MQIIIGIILWIFFLIALEQTIVRSIKGAYREMEEDKQQTLKKEAFARSCTKKQEINEKVSSSGNNQAVQSKIKLTNL